MRTVRKLVASLAFLAVTVVVVMFALSNREEVPVSLWPLPYSVSLRLSAALLGALAVGIVLGGAIAWASGVGRRYRRRPGEPRSSSAGGGQPAEPGVAGPPAAEPRRLTAAADRD